MPIYDYKCADCDHEDIEYQSMTEPRLTECPVCKGKYEKQVSAIHTPHQEYQTPILMHSIAYNHPDDVESFCRRHPDIKCSTDQSDPNYGIPIVKSREEKTRVLRTEGFQERN